MLNEHKNSLFVCIFIVFHGNCDLISDEQGEHFLLDIKKMERRYQCAWSHRRLLLDAGHMSSDTLEMYYARRISIGVASQARERHSTVSKLLIKMVKSL